MSLTAPAIGIPCFDTPFSFSAAGARVVEQNSYEEILACVQNVVLCSVGACPELPTFGRPDPTFQQGPPNAAALVAAVQKWEPRATESAVVQALDSSGADWAVVLTTQITGTGV